MTKTMRKLLAGLVLAGALVPAMAQNYPDKPVRFVVGFAPGGGTDILARLVATALQPRLGQPVVVENIPGASGTTAAARVKNGSTDGYTLLVGASGAMAISPAVQSKLSYDPVADFAPITVLGTYPIVFTAKHALGVKTTSELIAHAKANPGALNYGGAGVLFQLTAEMFNQRAGTSMTFVPYRGTGPAVAAVLGGEIDLLVADIGPVVQMIEGGRVQPIAITSSQRSPQLPNVPTVAESGLPGFNVDVFVGLFAKTGTPQPVIDRLHREIKAVLATPELQEQMGKLGISPSGLSPAETGSMLKAEIAKYTETARRGNIKVD